ncbi:MAG TPA: type 1 glutamine amidotransferase [Chromatiales bacterium]|nr:type 1 glutamine amidotransferase [Thiotrichales bacterium]HIP69291.1 type 1 glutamine amidotransferase [Chromatiales bacterium]
MKIHFLQHVPFEGPAGITDWITKHHHTATTTKLFYDETLPNLNSFDWLIVMGGPMGIDDTQQYPWLAAEKSFIAEAIAANKAILGICLGAQLIAGALGVEVRPNVHREIGWFNMTPSDELKDTILDGVFPEQTLAFHWHGDTFELPDNAKRIASSEACKNQGFILGDRVVGLQFHLETTPESASLLIENGRDELDRSRFVQTEAEMLESSERFDVINKMMFALLSRMESAINPHIA